MSTQQAAEVAARQRFEFGSNWAKFLELLDDSRITTAEESLERMIGPVSGKRFLDAGSGSGLFSLAARRLGATVHSFDYDPKSVACTEELRRRYFPDDRNWRVEQGSVLDKDYLSGLGDFDVVYSWGVLHHTGAMWRALELVAPLVRPEGQLFVALYNDQGTPSRRWLAVKKWYNRLPAGLRFLVVWPSFLFLHGRPLIKDVLQLRPFHSLRTYDKGARGMSPWRDLIDWVGGYPFEVARPEELLDFYRQRGFELERLKTTNDLGCNEWVFRRSH